MCAAANSGPLLPPPPPGAEPCPYAAHEAFRTLCQDARTCPRRALDRSGRLCGGGEGGGSSWTRRACHLAELAARAVYDARGNYPGERGALLASTLRVVSDMVGMLATTADIAHMLKTLRHLLAAITVLTDSADGGVRAKSFHVVAKSLLELWGRLSELAPLERVQLLKTIEWMVRWEYGAEERGAFARRLFGALDGPAPGAFTWLVTQAAQVAATNDLSQRRRGVLSSFLTGRNPQREVRVGVCVFIRAAGAFFNTRRDQGGDSAHGDAQLNSSTSGVARNPAAKKRPRLHALRAKEIGPLHPCSWSGTLVANPGSVAWALRLMAGSDDHLLVLLTESASLWWILLASSSDSSYTTGHLAHWHPLAVLGHLVASIGAEGAEEMLIDMLLSAESGVDTLRYLVAVGKIWRRDLQKKDQKLQSSAVACGVETLRALRAKITALDTRGLVAFRVEPLLRVLPPPF